MSRWPKLAKSDEIRHNQYMSLGDFGGIGMRPYIRFIATAFILGLTATQFQNCSEYSSGSSLYGNNCEETSTCAQAMTVTESTGYLTPQTVKPIMECTNDHIQIGGICEAGNASDTYIEYYITDNAGNKIQFAGGATDLREARCENGRFTMIIPRPPSAMVSGTYDTTTGVASSSSCATASCFREFRLNARLFALRKNTSQFEVAAVAPIFPMTFQLVIQTSSGNFCP